jgi:hypothetical protein
MNVSDPLDPLPKIVADLKTWNQPIKLKQWFKYWLATVLAIGFMVWYPGPLIAGYAMYVPVNMQSMHPAQTTGSLLLFTLLIVVGSILGILYAAGTLWSICYYNSVFGGPLMPLVFMAWYLGTAYMWGVIMYKWPLMKAVGIVTLFYVASISGYGPITQTITTWPYFASVYGMWTVLFALVIALPINLIFPTSGTGNLKGAMQGVLQNIRGGLPTLAQSQIVGGQVGLNELEELFRPAYKSTPGMVALSKSLSIDICFSRISPGNARLLAQQTQRLSSVLITSLAVLGFNEAVGGVEHPELAILVDSQTSQTVDASVQPQVQVLLDKVAGQLDYACKVLSDEKSVKPDTTKPDIEQLYNTMLGHHTSTTGREGLFLHSICSFAKEADRLAELAERVQSQSSPSRKLHWGGSVSSLETEYATWQLTQGLPTQFASPEMMQSAIASQTKQHFEDEHFATDNFTSSTAQLPAPKVYPGKRTPPMATEDGCCGLGAIPYHLSNFFSSEANKNGVKYTFVCLITGIWGVLPFSTEFFQIARLDWTMFSAVLVLSIPSIGATTWKALARIAAGIVGGIFAMLACLPDDGNNWISIWIIGAVLAIPMNFIQLYVPLISELGVVGMTTYLIITSSFYQVAKVPAYTYWELGLLRMAMLCAGSLVGMFTVWFIFPTLSRQRVRQYTAVGAADAALLVQTLSRAITQDSNTMSELVECKRLDAKIQQDLAIASSELQWAVGEPDLERPFSAHHYLEMRRLISGISAACISLVGVCEMALFSSSQSSKEAQNSWRTENAAMFSDAISRVTISLQIVAAAVWNRQSLGVMPTMDTSQTRNKESTSSSQFVRDMFSTLLDCLMDQAKGLELYAGQLFGKL